MQLVVNFEEGGGQCERDHRQSGSLGGLGDQREVRAPGPVGYSLLFTGPLTTTITQLPFYPCSPSTEKMAHPQVSHTNRSFRLQDGGAVTCLPTWHHHGVFLLCACNAAAAAAKGVVPLLNP